MSLKQQIDSLQKSLRQHQENTKSLMRANAEYQEIRQVLDHFDVSPDSIETQLEEKLNSLTKCSISTDKEIIKTKTKTIQKLRNLMHYKEEVKNQMLAREKKNCDEMIKLREKSIFKLTKEVTELRKREKQFHNIRKELNIRAEGWQVLIDKLYRERNERQAALEMTRQRMKLVVQQKNQLDAIVMSYLSDKQKLSAGKLKNDQKF